MKLSFTDSLIRNEAPSIEDMDFPGGAPQSTPKEPNLEFPGVQPVVSTLPKKKDKNEDPEPLPTAKDFEVDENVGLSAFKKALGGDDTPPTELDPNGHSIEIEVDPDKIPNAKGENFRRLADLRKAAEKDAAEQRALIVTMETSGTARDAELLDVQSQLKAMKERQYFLTPDKHPDIIKMTEDINSSWQRTARTIGGEEGAKLHSGQEANRLLNEFQDVGSISSPEYVEKDGVFAAKLQEDYPDNFREVRRWLTEALDARQSRQEKIDEMKLVGVDIEEQEKAARLKKEIKSFNSLKTFWENPDPQIIESSPNHPISILAKLYEENADFQKGKADTIKYLRDAMIEPETITGDLPDEDRAQMQKAAKTASSKKAESLKNMSFFSRESLRALPILHAQIESLKAQLAEREEPPSFLPETGAVAPVQKAASTGFADFEPVVPNYQDLVRQQLS